MLHQRLTSVLAEVARERTSQDRQWGEQNHPDGTSRSRANLVEIYRAQYESAKASGFLTWRHILQEEVQEAFAEEDPAALREELIQVAAVAVAWVQSIDRRQQQQPSV